MPQKLKKPTPDFLLTSHPRGVWCKKVHGRLYYFSNEKGPKEALRQYLRIKEELQAESIRENFRGAFRTLRMAWNL